MHIGCMLMERLSSLLYLICLMDRLVERSIFSIYFAKGDQTVLRDADLKV